MAEIIVYRTYPYSNKGYDPILDELDECLAKEGLEKKTSIVRELSSVSASTLYNWRHKKTRSPRHSTVMAVFTSLGYYPKMERTSRFDLEAERLDAKRWHLRREARKMAASKSKKSNGNRDQRPSV